jgi:hypothetical protein
MARHDDPRARALELELDAHVPAGDAEQFQGYGVMAAPFRSGDILAMRRFPSSSLGHGYTSVWHRDPSGSWTFWSDRAPLEACPRYFGRAISHSLTAPIEVSWPAPRRLEVNVPSAELRWTLELERTAATQVLNGLARVMPDRLWRNAGAMSLVSTAAGHLLHAGRLQLSGHAPNGQAFVANPTELWIIRSSSASLAGRDFGTLAPVPEQAHLGDFWIPQRGLFAFGRAFFEPANAALYPLCAETPSAAAHPS